MLLDPARNRASSRIDLRAALEQTMRVLLEFPKERLMKRVAKIVVLALPLLLVIGCDRPGPPVATGPARVEPQSPPEKNGRNPAVKNKKQPGLHSPMAPRFSKARF